MGWGRGICKVVFIGVNRFIFEVWGMVLIAWGKVRLLIVDVG